MRWKQENTREVHNKPSAGFKMFDDKIAVGTSDGFLSLSYVEGLKPVSILGGGKQELHKMPISSIAYVPQDQTLITASVDYKYKITPLTSFSVLKCTTHLLTCCGLLLIILLICSD